MIYYYGWPRAVNIEVNAKAVLKDKIIVILLPFIGKESIVLKLALVGILNGG